MAWTRVVAMRRKGNRAIFRNTQIGKTENLAVDWKWKRGALRTIPRCPAQAARLAAAELQKALEEEQVWTWAGWTWGSMEWGGGGEDTEKFKMRKLEGFPFAV